ncbi:MAG TPA: methyltransferase domain-containing protein [Stellaceae bacterium]|nr:methyltransferase domain-containing protein [Stellaceae bacterium]
MSEGNRAATFFDAYAGDFNAIYGTANTLPNRVINRLFRQAMRLRYEKTLAGCEPIAGRTAIDVGCGPGHYAIALARAGASDVLGLDFASGMIDLARRNAATAGVEARCRWEYGDFLTHPISSTFDYAVVMGFMDYIADPARVVARVLQLTRRRAFFSFPVAGGVLAWQRKLRYRSRCDLFLYRKPQLEVLFEPFAPGRFKIEPIDRDYFVTVEV